MNKTFTWILNHLKVIIAAVAVIVVVIVSGFVILNSYSAYKKADEKYNENNEDKVALANKCYVYCMAHKEECNPVPTELTIKQSIWKSYGVAVGGFDPERDGVLK